MKRLTNEDKVGLYITVIIHLMVAMVLLFIQIGYTINPEKGFLIDFSREEAIARKEKIKKELEKDESFDESISRKLDQMLAGTSGLEFKNIATNRSNLKDDRGTDAEKLYKDAEKLANDLKNGFEVDEKDEDYVETPGRQKIEKKETKEYSGPSVVSYELDGRKATNLRIPAYRCYNGGMVTVLITVDNQGRVINAKIQEETSSNDKCLRDFAIRAARMSRFQSSTTAPARQGGNIVYQFIAQ